LVTSETWIQAAFLIELADDLRELLSRSAGQNDGRTLIPKASGCYGAHAGTGAGHDDQLAFESLETHTFFFRTECSGLFAVLPQEDRRLLRRLDRWRVDVVSQGRTFSGTVAPG
jgi:hypothetical protein